MDHLASGVHTYEQVLEVSVVEKRFGAQELNIDCRRGVASGPPSFPERWLVTTRFWSLPSPSSCS